MARGQHAQGLKTARRYRHAARGVARRLGSAAQVASQDARGRMGRNQLAQGIRRARRQPDPADHLQRGDGARGRTAARQRARHHAGRPDADSLGHRRAEAALRTEDSLGRRDLVPGIFGTRRRFRRRLAADPRGRGRRLLRRQRPEGLDLRRASRRLVYPAGSHRSRRAQAQGNQLRAGRYAQPRRHGAPAGSDHRRQRLQRSFLRGRQSPARRT